MIYAEIRGKSIYFPYNDNEIGVLKENRVQRVVFKLQRSEVPENLIFCKCTLQVENSAGQNDIVSLPFSFGDEMITAEWLVSRAITQKQGELKIQLCFDENDENGITWRSNISVCRIMPGIDAGEGMMTAYPQYFREWQDKMDTLYLQTAQLASGIEDAAEFVYENRERLNALPQLLEDLSQTAQDAEGAISQKLTESEQIRQDINSHSIATQQHSQAAAGARNEAVSAALSAKSYAESAKAITGLSEGAFLFSDTAKNSGVLSFTDVHPDFRELNSLKIYGKIISSSQGEHSIDNPGSLSGVGESGAITLVVYAQERQDEYTLALSQPLYKLPNGTEDIYDIKSGGISRHTAKLMLTEQSECVLDEISPSASADTVSFRFPLDFWNIRETPTYTPKAISQYVAASHFSGSGITCADDHYVQDREMLSLQAQGPFKNFRIRLLKSRLAGWSDSLSDIEKTAMFRSWLSENPITVIYELLQPVEEEVTPVSVSLFAPVCTAAVQDISNPWLEAVYYKDISKVMLSVLSDIQELKSAAGA